jgi:hypothetical protein
VDVCLLCDSVNVIYYSITYYIINEKTVECFYFFFQKKVKETDQENSLSKCDSDQDQPSKEHVVIKLKYFLK